MTEPAVPAATVCWHCYLVANPSARSARECESMGYALVDNPLAGSHIRRYGQVALPFELIGLGVYIFVDARVLFR